MLQHPFTLAVLISSMIFCNHRYGGPTGVVKVFVEQAAFRADWTAITSV
jgi:hypothetical protein